MSVGHPKGPLSSDPVPVPSLTQATSIPIVFAEVSVAETPVSNSIQDLTTEDEGWAEDGCWAVERTGDIKNGLPFLIKLSITLPVMQQSHPEE